MNVTSRRMRLVLPVLAGSLVLSACGLKSDVNDTLASQARAGGSVGGTGDVLVDEVLPEGEVPLDANGVPLPEGEVPVDPAAAPAEGAADPAAGGGAAAPAAGGGGAGGGGGGAAAAKPGAAAAPAAPAGGGSTVGIKGDTITLTVHAPLTGASPLPQTSFQAGADEYWKGKKVQGKYNVKVNIVDDKYNPNGAVQACRRAVPGSFLIVGGAGTDQIQACARDSVLRQAKVPYLSAGVTTNGLEDINTYAAISMTYKAQSSTIVRMAREQGFLKRGDTWALVLSGTPNFEDAKTSMTAALQAEGIKVEYFPAPKAGGDAGPIASQLAAKRPEVVYFLGQPIYFADLVRKTASASYAPFWVGPGVSMGVNSIAALTCGNPAYDKKGFFLSPYPGFDKKAQVAGNANLPDDIALSIYGLQQLLDQAFQQVKGPLTREAFTAALAQSQLQGGVYSPAVFAGKTRFGGTKAYTLMSECPAGGTGRYVTKSGPIS